MIMRMQQIACRNTSTLLLVMLTLYVTVTLLIFSVIQEQQDTDTANDTFGRQRRMPAASLHVPCASDTDIQPALRYDSTDATVMAYATGYELPVYQKFVGSLRHSGFTGKIILAVSQDMKDGVEDYLLEKNVTFHHTIPTNCTHPIQTRHDGVHEQEQKTCVHPYPELKARWSRFPLLRDYLVKCKECTGPVLVTDVRDVFFQRDPFGDGVPEIEGLQVFEEWKEQTTEHKLVKSPLVKCKNITLGHRPMLCSGTTIGTRQSMIQYLSIMEREMRDWMKDEKCCCNQMNGDDQTIHNYLYYTNKLPFGMAIPNRMGIINTVGAQGAMIWNAHIASRMTLVASDRQAAVTMPMDGADPKGDQWLGSQFGLVDSEGYFTQFDGTRSRVIHQYDRFGVNGYMRWIQRQKGELWP